MNMFNGMGKQYKLAAIAGNLAYRKGFSKEDNPHPIDSSDLTLIDGENSAQRHAGWFAGWCEGEYEDRNR